MSANASDRQEMKYQWPGLLPSRAKQVLRIKLPHFYFVHYKNHTNLGLYHKKQTIF
jgi:hypothetical protein